MIKVNIRDGIKSINEEKMYFKRIITREEGTLALIAYYFYIGEIKDEEIFGMKSEYQIDEEVVEAIKEKFPNTPI
jgi:hypothetical protein